MNQQGFHAASVSAQDSRIALDDRVLPSGWVTFLFTDIEGSTRLFQRLQERYAAMLADHDQLLASVIASQGGTVVTSMGDGLFAAFSDTAKAVAAVAEIQRALGRHRWPDGIQLLVRAGLHCGAAEARDGNYVALPVHQAARVTAAAYGGQVLCTADIVERAPDPHGAVWENVGSYRLKDFDEPVQLFQLLMDGAATRPPAGTRATPAAAHNVPELGTSFVGRKTELQELTTLLTSGSRIVSVLGPGGVGKTRLAFEAIKSVAPMYEDGAWVVLLSNASTGEELVDGVLRTLRLSERGDATPLQTLVSALHRRRMLLLLDNTEQITDEAARVTRELLDNCPNVTVSVTSRQPLGLRGEVEWRLPPLQLTADTDADAASVELFIQRAVTRNPKATFDAADRVVIEDICRQVDGLPLGIELAAGRLRHMTLRDLAARLHDQLRVASSRDRDLDQRQRTLDAMVHWSYRLLTTPAQTLLRRMSVLQGAVALETVEALADAGGEVPQLLDELVDKSLINFDDDSDLPYRMLVTIRDFAHRLLLEAGESDDARSRHLRLHLALAHRLDVGLRGRDAKQWLARGDRSSDDFAAALSFSSETGDDETFAVLANSINLYLVLRGRLKESESLATRAAASRCTPAVRARALATQAFHARLHRQPATALRLAEQALELALASGDSEAVAYTRFRMGTVLWDDADQRRRGREMMAEALADSALPAHWRGEMLNGLGALHECDGDLEQAARMYRAAADFAERTGYVVLLPPALVNLGDVLGAIGRADEAVDVLRRALEAAVDLGRDSLHNIYRVLAKNYVALGDAENAARFTAAGLELARERGAEWAIEEMRAAGLVLDDGASTLSAD